MSSFPSSSSAPGTNRFAAVAATNGLSAATAALDLEDATTTGLLPMFDVERVQLQFSVAGEFVCGAVANNVLILAISTGRILRIDLNKAEDIDDIDLPKKASEVGIIRRMFLDPTASHLLICTATGENYYLHSQSKLPRPLGRLRGVSIESVAWNPLLPTASTREILLGASDGNIYEVSIETSTEFYKKEVKHLEVLHKLPDGPITGVYVDALPGGPDLRRVLIATQSRLFHLVGKIGQGHDGSRSVYTKLFESEQPAIHELSSRTLSAAVSSLVVSPDLPTDELQPQRQEGSSHERAYAWLSQQGVFHGRLLTAPADATLGSKVFAESKLLPRSQLVSSPDPSTRRRSAVTDYIEAVALTQWHVLHLVGGRVVATNRLTGAVVYDQIILDPGQKAVGFSVDLQKNTFWLFTAEEVFEIVVRDEDRDIWKIMLKQQQFEAALQYARTVAQKETVATAYGDFLTGKGHFTEAAAVYGRSNKPFEEVALSFIDNQQQDALRKYLMVRLAMTDKSATMQRIMVASWLVEIFMAKLNSLDDTITTQAELAENLNTAQSMDLLEVVRKEFQDFVNRYKHELDRRTVYDVISSHGREGELLYFANAVNDYHYVLSYWAQRERWDQVMNVLKKQTDPDAFYRYSTVLMTNVATDFVEILMRHADLRPRNLIPSLLEYGQIYKGSLAQNQAIRYLQYVVNQLDSKDSAVHNCLVALYASAHQTSKDESGLLSYLESQGDEPRFDPDFALRQCIEYHRTLSCVHLYTNMGQYLEAVDLALSHGEIELASVVADRAMSNPPLRKRLWLAVARKVISQSGGSIKTAIEFLKRCELLKIEDLIPFFPDFVTIDDFKDEICSALEDYSRNIDSLKREMDESAQTAANIKVDIAALDRRYAIVEPGERCYVCGLPLLSRAWYVFPCQHAFHQECLGRKVVEQAGVAKSKQIKDLQMQISKGLVSGAEKERLVKEFDGLVAAACILCSDYAIKRIDEPFVTADDNLAEWAL